MSSLDEHMTRAHPVKTARSLFHRLRVADICSRQNRSLGEIRRHDQREGKEGSFEHLLTGMLEEMCAGTGYHHRIHNEVRHAVPADLVGDDINNSSGSQHSRFHCGRNYVGHHRIQLQANKIGRDVHHIADSLSVLRRKGCDNTHSINIQACKGFQVRLNTRAAAGV